MIGKTLAHYEIIDLLGKGGMGEVYRATDTKLGREVAIKVLPREMADDPERLARFQREARTLASLRHPNIAAIYGLEEAEGQLFLAMELAEGEDLSERLERTALSWEDALEIARQIARGLEEAHQKGVVHRDLKPSNVKIGPDGTVRILDFGLARAMTGDRADEEDISTSPTITAAMTQAGTILGTAAYMSPEQARGRPIDQRADIWAFGVVLWEMLSGRRLFDGDTTSDVLANVLKHPIDLDVLPSDLPMGARRAIERCLVRDPQDRWHSVADVRIEMETGDSTDGPGPRTDVSFSARLPWVLAVAFLFLTALMAWQSWTNGPVGELPSMAVGITLPDEIELALIDWPAVAISEDGQTLALTARLDGTNKVIIRSLATPEIRSISGSGSAFSVFFSPNGRWLGYYSDSRLMKVNVEGGAPVEIAASAHPRGATWGDDGYVYYSPEYSTGIFRIPDAGGGVPEVLTTPDLERSERTHRWPDALPGGRGVVFTVGMADSPGDYESAEIAVYDVRREQARRLGIKGAIARYAPTGHLLVMRNGVLHAVRFDLDSLETVGAPVPVFDGIRGDPASGMYYFDLDGRGNLYYVAARAGGPQRRLTWIDRSGNAQPVALPAGRYRYPRLHPEDDRAVLVLGEGHGNNDDIYLLDFADANLTRLTFDQGSIQPNWLPSGDAFVYNTVKSESMLIRHMGRSAEVDRIPMGSRGIFLPNAVGRDGRTILATKLGSRTLGDIWVFVAGDSTQSRPIFETEAAEWGADFSPDQKWVVYAADETGREEIFVQPYPPTGAKWQVSFEGGRAPRWSEDGTEIFFVLGDRFYRAAIQTDPEVRIQRPEVLFEHRMDSSGVPLANYDVTSDGQRFLIVEPDESTGTGRVEIVLGWAEKLKGLNE